MSTTTHARVYAMRLPAPVAAVTAPGAGSYAIPRMRDAGRPRRSTPAVVPVREATRVWLAYQVRHGILMPHLDGVGFDGRHLVTLRRDWSPLRGPWSRAWWARMRLAHQIRAGRYRIEQMNGPELAQSTVVSIAEA